MLVDTAMSDVVGYGFLNEIEPAFCYRLVLSLGKSGWRVHIGPGRYS